MESTTILNKPDLRVTTTQLNESSGPVNPLNESQDDLQLDPTSPAVEYQDFVLSDDDIIEDDDEDDIDIDTEGVMDQAEEVLQASRQRARWRFGRSSTPPPGGKVGRQPRTPKQQRQSQHRRSKSVSRGLMSRRRQPDFDLTADDADADDEQDIGERTPSMEATGNATEAAMMVDDKPWRQNRQGRKIGSTNRKPILRYIRSLGAKNRKDDGSDEDDEEDKQHQDDDSSSTSSAEDLVDVEDYDSWDDAEEDDFDDTLLLDPSILEQQSIPLDSLPIIPNSFTSLDRMSMSMLKQQKNLSYLDGTMWQADTLTTKDAHGFGWEHSLFLQAVIQLLAQREQVGVEGSVDYTDNIWKKGPLKKLSFVVGGRRRTGAWNVKYVELRKGNLVYYDDSNRTSNVNNPTYGRKTIHLREAEAVVKESDEQWGPGFVFEILVQGSPPRYWWAQSNESRQAWIRAIRSAMIGSEQAEDNNKPLDLAPYQTSVKLLSELREAVRDTDLQETYVSAIEKVEMELELLQVPVQWVRESILLDNNTDMDRKKPPKRKWSAQDRLSNDITKFWKSIRQLSFSVNGFVVPRDTPVAAERVIGALTRSMLEFDKAFRADDFASDEATKQNQISEMQAVAYARSILQSILRGVEEKICERTVRGLLQGRQELVTISRLVEDDDITSLTRLELSFAGDDMPGDSIDLEEEDMATWICVSRRKQGKSTFPNIKGKKRYAVLSGSVISLFEASSPRPHGLRSQFVLRAGNSIEPEELKNDQQLSDRPQYVIVISGDESNLQKLLIFDDKDDMETWKEALQQKVQELDKAVCSQPSKDMPVSTPAKKIVKGAERVIKGAADNGIRGGIRVIRGAKDSGRKAMKIAADGSMKVMRIATDGSMKMLRGTVGRLRPSARAYQDNSVKPELARAPSLQVLLNESKGQGKREPTVQCVTQRALVFTIRATQLHPVGEEESGKGKDNAEVNEIEIWKTVRVTWTQAFLMSGGPNGRLHSGDALMVIDFIGGKDGDEGEWVSEIEVL